MGINCSFICKVMTVYVKYHTIFAKEVQQKMYSK